MTDRALKIVSESTRRPLFLYLHYMDAHAPYFSHEGLGSDSGYTGPIDGSRASLDPFNSKRPPPSDERHAIALYDGEIAWLDARLRDLFDGLGRSGLLESAWVVLTADHGEGLWAHGVRAHGNQVYEEQVRIPLLVRPPGGLVGGRRVSAPISLVDVAPTILDLLGRASQPEFEGQSWAAFIRNAGPAPTRPIIVDEELGRVELSAIIEADRKVIVDRRGGWVSLFDLAADAAESAGQRFRLEGDLAPPLSDMIQRLEAEQARARRRRPASAAGTAVETEMPAAVREQLRQLGYLED